ncbi:hypothetical protein [Deinococcus sp.]|jgi:hypothetical protein|uniref:hypothetical protein n=1 Tax=Deinococcus sp. TaxID=47478 RepID=UPI00391DA939
MTLLSVIGFIVLLQVFTGVALGLCVAYLALRGPRHSLNTTRQLNRYPTPQAWKAVQSNQRGPQAGD